MDQMRRVNEASKQSRALKRGVLRMSCIRSVQKVKRNITNIKMLRGAKGKRTN